jgi:hypothetical protein
MFLNIKITITSKRIKCIGIIFNQGVKELCTENGKTLMEENEGDTTK